jgi:CheY-like chemotaxis protein
MCHLKGNFILVKATMISLIKTMNMKSRVILIDDNPLENIFHEQMFRKLDQEIEISIIDNGPLALVSLKKEFAKKKLNTRTTIFLDEHMPELKGLEIMEILEELDIIADHNIQIYFLTTDTSLRLIEKTTVMPNVNRVIHKPLVLSDLQGISL